MKMRDFHSVISKRFPFVIRLFAALFALLSMIAPLRAMAYPEMVRYGYVNCNSCHVSLTGGGLLNDYGREIAREKLAMFKSSDEKSKESRFAYGVFGDAPFQKYLKAGGDVRSVYYYRNDDNVKQAQTVFMQGDLEAALVTSKFTVDGTAGIEQPVPGQTVNFISRRHYAQYALSDAFNLRAGKFVPAYGINTPDHITLTRDPLQLGDNYESYNLELSFISAQWNAFITGIFGRFDDKHSGQDRGFSAQAAYAPTERIKLGANLWYGEREQAKQSRWLVGPFGLISLTQDLVLESEIDFQFRTPNRLDTQKGMASTQKLSYELTEGLWIYALQEYGKYNFLSIQPYEDYGIGIQFFPRSHFEFNLAYERARQTRGSGNFSDYAWFMSHFYL